MVLMFCGTVSTTTISAEIKIEPYGAEKIREVLPASPESSADGSGGGKEAQADAELLMCSFSTRSLSIENKKRWSQPSDFKSLRREAVHALQLLLQRLPLRFGQDGAPFCLSLGTASILQAYHGAAHGSIGTGRNDITAISRVISAKWSQQSTCATPACTITTVIWTSTTVTNMAQDSAGSAKPATIPKRTQKMLTSKTHRSTKPFYGARLAATSPCRSPP